MTSVATVQFYSGYLFQEGNCLNPHLPSHFQVNVLNSFTRVDKYIVPLDMMRNCN